VCVFIAADRLCGDAVDVGKPVEPTAHQHRVHGRGGNAEPVTDLDRTEPLLAAKMQRSCAPPAAVSGSVAGAARIGRPSLLALHLDSALPTSSRPPGHVIALSKFEVDEFA